MSEALYKFPRLYVAASLGPGDTATLADTQAHYLKTVLRRNDGDHIRLFNGQDGEWLASLAFTGKRGVTAALIKQTRPQPPRNRRVHLLFSPLKKDRLDTLIEKAVELDATDLHPVITERTEVRALNEGRIHSQIIEAAEQCERLDLPELHAIEPMEKLLARWLGCPVFVGLERSDAKTLNDGIVPLGDCAALIGPAGGWSDKERESFSHMHGIVPVSLGANILRSETAAAVMLTRFAVR